MSATHPGEKVQPIPISAPREIAEQYGYDQVVIVARRVGEAPDPHGEHCTTYGRTPDHSDVAARIGAILRHRVMQWPHEDIVEAVVRGVCELPDYNSPDDQPELLQCTVKELELVVRRAIGEDV